MTNEQFHTQRTVLHNEFAAAGARLLDFMRGAAGALAAIPNTSPEQYAVAGDLAAIQALLRNRRMRHGQRPTEELYWGPEAGQARKWTILLTPGGHGLVGELGSKFEHGKPEHERVDVVEIVPGIANKAAEEGELPEPVRMSSGQNYLGFTADQMRAYARQAIAADRAARAGASEDARDAARYRWLRNPDTDVAMVLDKQTGFVEPIEGLPGVGGYHTYEYRAGEELDAAIDAAMGSVPFSPSAPVGAVPSIETPELRRLLALLSCTSGTENFNAERRIIAHFDQHVASQVRVALEEAAKACEGKFSGNGGPPDDPHPDSVIHNGAVHDCAKDIRALKGRPAISHSGEGEKGGANA